MGYSLTEPKAAFEGGATRSSQDERFDLISPHGMHAMARRLALGAAKHGERNWERGGEDFRKATISHLMAHLVDYMQNGNSTDANTDAIICNAMFLCHFEAKAPFIPHQSAHDESTTCPANANGAAKTSRNDPPASAANNAKSTTAPSSSAKAEPAHSPQPDGCSSPLESAPAPTATEAASASADDLQGHAVARKILERLEAGPAPWWSIRTSVDSETHYALLARLEDLRMIRIEARLTDLGRASLHPTRIAEPNPICGQMLGEPGRTRTCTCILVRGHDGRHRSADGTSWRNLK